MGASFTHHYRSRSGRTFPLMVALACVVVSLAVFAQSAPLTLVSTAWPPFTNAPGQPRFALDLVEAAFSRIGVKASTKIVPADQFTDALVSGPFDGSAAAWKDEERERALIFSAPYLENRLVLVARRGADVSAKSLSDLKGKRVAIVEGYSYGAQIESAGLTIVRSRSEEDSLAQLLNNRVDCTLMDELVVQYIFRTYPKESAVRLEFGTTPLLSRSLYLAVRRSNPAAESIVEKFNAQLRGMIADRTYHRLLHVDWIRADINGDGVAEFVPSDDRAGATEPKRVYTLFSSPQIEQPTDKPGFYVGGSIYSDWASVPDTYKVAPSQQPDSRRSTATLFKFVW